MGHTTQLLHWLELARRGDVEARGAILEHTCDRLRKLSRKMLRGFPRVRRWSETDDVLQNALLRLHRALAEVQPESPRQFYGLAATQIRRELLDLAKHYHGAEGIGANHQSDSGTMPHAQQADSVRPETLEKWTRFHEHVESLPESEREVVALIWYNDIPQIEVATILGVSLATVKRRWQAARLRLCELLEEWDLEG
jgi:RNA polymerase sigma-70 factor (ECF subfamily)